MGVLLFKIKLTALYLSLAMYVCKTATES